MSSGRISLERDGAILIATLEREEKLNAIDAPMIDALREVVDLAEASDDLRALIFTGAGRAFCVGADIEVFSKLDPIATWNDWVRQGHALIDRLAALPIPTIGAINGYCFGGGLELALALDFCIAAEPARFAAPEVRIGTVPGWGGSQRLVHAIGTGRARRMIFSGAQIDANTAERWGLTTETTEAGELLARARNIAFEIADNAPTAVRIAKQLTNGAAGNAVGATMESLAGGLAKASQDGTEGLAAFLEKRPPVYTGK